MELAHTGRSFSRPQSSLNIQNIFIFGLFLSHHLSLSCIIHCLRHCQDIAPFSKQFFIFKMSDPRNDNYFNQRGWRVFVHLGVVAAAVAALDRFAGPEKQWRGAKPNQVEAGQQHGPGQSSSLSHRPRQRHPHVYQCIQYIRPALRHFYIYSQNKKSSVQSQNAPPFEISPPLLLQHWHRNTLE